MSNFTKREFEAYQTMRHEDWDRGVIAEAFIEDNPDVVESIAAKGAASKAREIAKGFRDAGFPLDAIAKQTGLSEEEIKAL